MSKITFSDKAIEFVRNIEYTGDPLPNGIRIMNPFKEYPKVLPVAEQFYKKFYNDNNERIIILGINPSRLGAGLTGIPFTDPKKLVRECGIDYDGRIAHEPSSTFIYEMIAAYGGVHRFYENFYINSPCPLGFTKTEKTGKETNYNYYDSPELYKASHSFIIQSLHKLVKMGIRTDICFCLGIGKNEKFIKRMNDDHQFFKEIIPLEHPRWIMQYKSRNKKYYIDKYISVLSSMSNNQTSIGS
jgi:hypothetical protein